MFIILLLVCTAWHAQASDQYRKNIAQLEILHEEIRELQAEISSLAIERTQKTEHLRRLLKHKKIKPATVTTTKNDFLRILYKDNQCNIQ